MKSTLLNGAERRRAKRTLQLLFDTWVQSADIEGCSTAIRTEVVHHKNMLLKLLKKK